MTSFADELARFRDKTGRLAQKVFVGSVADATSSIVFGSPLTGAPGQVVQDSGPGIIAGNLRASWVGGVAGGTPGFKSPKFVSPTVAVIGTMCPYAPQNEDGIARPGGGPYTQRSFAGGGGRWSVALTVAAWPRIVESVAERFNP